MVFYLTLLLPITHSIAAITSARHAITLSVLDASHQIEYDPRIFVVLSWWLECPLALDGVPGLYPTRDPYRFRTPPTKGNSPRPPIRHWRPTRPWGVVVCSASVTFQSIRTRCGWFTYVFPLFGHPARGSCLQFDSAADVPGASFLG